MEHFNWQIIYLVGALATIIIGHYRAYGYRKELQAEKGRKMSVLGYLWYSLFSSLAYPGTLILFYFGPLIYWPVILIIVCIDRSFYDGAKSSTIFLNHEPACIDIRSRPIYSEFERRERFSEKQRQFQEDYDNILGASEAGQEFGEFTTRALAFVMLLVGFMLTPFTGYAKAAKDKQVREGEETGQTLEVESEERPAGPPLPEIHGVLMGSLNLVGDETGKILITPALAQAQLKVMGDIIPGRLSYFNAFGLHSIASGGDPVLMSTLTYDFGPVDVTAGRILPPIGYGRQCGPTALTELSYADLGHAVPWFDHGFVIGFDPSERVRFDLGIITGHGTAIEPDASPMGLFRARFLPRDEITIEFAGGYERSEIGHTGEADAAVHLNGGTIEFQTEVAANFYPATDDTGPMQKLGWYALGVLHPIDWLDVYGRFDGLDASLTDDAPPDLSVIAGMNVRPVPKLGLRAALTLPLVPSPSPTLTSVIQLDF